MQNAVLKKAELPYEVNEELKYLRTNIQFSGEDKKVILITSSYSGEGKSTITLYLAKSLAELGKRVLLIDADLRRSHLIREFEGRHSVTVGLSHYLSGQASLSDALVSTEDPHLYVFVSGPVPPNPAELLAGRKMADMIDWARSQFDYILIDSAPLATVVDAAVLAPKSDGAAIIVEAGKTPYRLVRSVSEQLADAGCPVLGVILNKVDKSSGGKYYGRYYNYRSYYASD